MQRHALIACLVAVAFACDEPEPLGGADRSPSAGAASGPTAPAGDDAERAFVEGVTRALPDTSVRPRPDGRLGIWRAGEEATIFDPTSLREECRRGPSSCPQTVEAHVSSVVRSLTEPDEEALDLANLRMVLQGEQALRAQAPHMMEASWPLAGDLRWHFAIDRPDSIHWVNTETIERLGADREALEARARANMREAFGPLRHFLIPDSPGVYAIDTSGGGLESDSYDAARLVLHDAWRPLTDVVPGDLVAAAPARDAAIFAGTGTPGAIDALRYLATAMNRGELHPVSPQLVRWTPDGWVPY